MAIHIQDFAGKEQFQSILYDWALATGLEAMVQSADAKSNYFADAVKREPGKADASDHNPKISVLLLLILTLYTKERSLRLFFLRVLPRKTRKSRRRRSGS